MNWFSGLIVFGIMLGILAVYAAALLILAGFTGMVGGVPGAILLITLIGLFYLGVGVVLAAILLPIKALDDWSWLS